MPTFLDHHSFCENLPEVNSTKVFFRGKFHPNGLFSEHIFGPVKNYSCQCGYYHGPTFEGQYCNECGVPILEGRSRREKFAKITLPISVINPIFYDMLKEVGGSSVIKPIEKIIKEENSVLFKTEEGDCVIEAESNVPPGFETWDKLDAIYELVRVVSEDYKDDDYRWKMIYDNLDKLFTSEIIVLPPELRPASVKANVNELDEINRYYMQILMKKEVMSQTVVNIHRDKNLFYNYFRQLQRNVNDLYKQILDKLSKKTGLIRGNILGKRVDFSGRGVIAPGPDMNIDWCKLPYVMFLELFKLDIARKLIEIEQFKILNEAIEFVEECIRHDDTSLFDLCKKMIREQNEVCILNRQPSLHKLSMVGFYIDISLEKVIRLHPLACPGFNADFDGDSIAAYIPITENTKNEAKEKLLMSNNLVNPANDKLITVPNQDVVFGIYVLTNNLINNLNERVNFKGIKMTKGRMIFNQCLPDDFRAINDNIDKKRLNNILDELKENYSSEVIKECLDNIKKEGFKYSTLYGSTMSLDKFELSNKSSLLEDIYGKETIQEQLREVQSDEIESDLSNQFYYSPIIKSGARGDWQQVKQVVLTRGFISNFKGKIMEEPIKGCLVDGLNEQEFFYSTYGCRKGLLDVALNTGNSGYLSRKLIMAMANLQLDYDNEDCGTTDYLDVHVEDEHKAKMLIKKYYVDNNNNLNLITKDNYKSLIGKKIKIRSPIYCKTYNICRKCYGELETNSKYIGIIAAQSLGERATQLVLRTFHTSGVASTSSDSDSMEQEDIVSGLSRVTKLLHREVKEHSHQELLKNLFDVYRSAGGDLFHVHFECLVAQLMWKGDDKWRILENRDKVNIEHHSIQAVPEKESWLLALAFSNPRKSILKGILNSGHYKGIFDKILSGEKLNQ